jgi:hypothetical protein
MRLPPQAKPAIRIPAPLKKPIGLGDAIKSLTSSVGFEPCAGCRKRAATLNRWLAFVPYGERKTW